MLRPAELELIRRLYMAKDATWLGRVNAAMRRRPELLSSVCDAEPIDSSGPPGEGSSGSPMIDRARRERSRALRSLPWERRWHELRGVPPPPPQRLRGQQQVLFSLGGRTAEEADRPALLAWYERNLGLIFDPKSDVGKRWQAAVISGGDPARRRMARWEHDEALLMHSRSRWNTPATDTAWFAELHRRPAASGGAAHRDLLDFLRCLLTRLATTPNLAALHYLLQCDGCHGIYPVALRGGRFLTTTGPGGELIWMGAEKYCGHPRCRQLRHDRSRSASRRRSRQGIE